MSNVLAVPSKGTQLFYGDTSSPPVYTVISRQGSLTGLEMAGKEEDVTAQDSGTPWRDWIITLLDAGHIALDMFFLPADTSQKAVLLLFTQRGLNNTPGLPIPFKLLFSDVAGTVWTFNGFIATFKISATVDGVIKAAMSVRGTGEPTFPV